MSASDVAIAVIKQEHRGLTMVVQVLQRLLFDIAGLRTEPDYALLSAALYYIEDFPERFHHPKEDEHIFKALRLSSAEFNPVLDELQAEHIRSAHMMSILQRALVHYQGGAPEGLARFHAAVDAYAAMLDEHMRKEEELLYKAQGRLSAEDWAAITAAFEANDDPLFGSSCREEFRKLHYRIVMLLPRKMRLPPRQTQ